MIVTFDSPRSVHKLCHQTQHPKQDLLCCAKIPSGSLSFAKSLRRHHKDFFPLDVSSSVLVAGGPVARRKMLAESVNRALSGFQEEEFSELLLLSLRCHRITMVQPAESRKGLNLVFTRRANFCCTTCWRVVPRQNLIRSRNS